MAGHQISVTLMLKPSFSLSRQFSVSKRTGQGIILDPFMYKVYLDVLLNALSSHAFSITINSLSLPSPSFADDISLLSIQLISREFKLRCKHNM